MQRKEFLTLAVSELVSFAAAVSGFTGVTDSGSNDENFSLHEKFPMLNGNALKLQPQDLSRFLTPAEVIFKNCFFIA